MIFRNNNGELLDINKCDFKNDRLFYKKIVDIKKPEPFTKLNEMDEMKQMNQTNDMKKYIKKVNFSNYIIHSKL